MRWKKELEKYNPSDVTQEIEIDAYAFAQVIGNCEFGINYKCEDPLLQKLVEDYIQSGKILNDN